MLLVCSTVLRTRMGMRVWVVRVRVWVNVSYLFKTYTCLPVLQGFFKVWTHQTLMGWTIYCIEFGCNNCSLPTAAIFPSHPLKLCLTVVLSCHDSLSPSLSLLSSLSFVVSLSHRLSLTLAASLCSLLRCLPLLSPSLVASFTATLLSPLSTSLSRYPSFSPVHGCSRAQWVVPYTPYLKTRLNSCRRSLLTKGWSAGHVHCWTQTGQYQVHTICRSHEAVPAAAQPSPVGIFLSRHLSVAHLGSQLSLTMVPPSPHTIYLSFLLSLSLSHCLSRL
jgi:hypothetical protein